MSPPLIIGGRFEQGALIGQGGMGTVYRGLDRQTGKQVAIKALRTDLGDLTANVIERFEREAEALRRLNHPSIVQIVATAEEDGRHYLILEYVEGGSLAQILQAQPQLPVEQVLRIALDIADALTRAHRLKIIHRDIKPHNVLLAEDGTPRLTDFGVAHLDDRSRLTQSGSMVGTYAYLSPEGCHGQDLDERADIWSFGVMLFEMLAGQRPFAGTTPGTILTAILSKPTPDLAALRPDLPPRLVALVSQMLQKDRAQRTASVRMVGAELEAIMRGDPAPSAESPGVTRVLEPRESSRFNTPTTPSAGVPLTPTPALSTRELPPEPAVPTPAQTSSRTPLIIGAALVLALVIGGALIFSRGRMAGQEPLPADAAQPASLAVATSAPTVVPTALPTAEPTVPPTAVPAPLVEPVAQGEYMVLVARLEPLGGASDPTRFVLDNLAQAFEDEVPFTHVRVREYPQVITSADAAQAAAADNKAPLVVWGNYDDSGVELNIAIGVTDAFRKIKIERAVLERTANVRVRLSDPRNESAAVPLLVALNVLRNADGNVYELLRTVASLEELKVPPAEVVGNSVAARVNRYFLNYFDNSEQALAEIQAAISLAPNPILYTYQGAAHFRMGQIEESLTDMETARRTGPEGWTSPLVFIGGTAAIIGPANPETLQQSIKIYDQIIAQQPDDWFALYTRGTFSYLLGNLEAARADQERAIALGPDVNMPYIAAAQIALREARLADAVGLIQAAVARFPNPTFGQRVFNAFYGDKVSNFAGPLSAGFGSLLFGQYREAVAYADAALAVDGRLTDAYFMRGFAQCNLGQPAEAEASYSQAIALAPDYGLLYLLRAEVRAAQQNLPGAQEDLAAAATGPQAAALADALAAAQAGSLSCRTLFAP